MSHNNDRLLNITDKDILLLKIFDAVVKAGSFTAAEACLNKSKSAISIHISSLETRLGKKLCHRGRSGFSLTPEGEKVYEICKELFVDLDRYRDRLNRVSPLVGGALTLVLDDSLFGRQGAVTDALEKIKTALPNVFLSVYVTSPERVMQSLKEGSADVAVSAIPKEVPGTEMYSLYQENLALYCGSKHPLFMMNDADISDAVISEYEAIDLGSYQEPSVEEAMSALSQTARSGQVSARLLLILSGKWIGFLPCEFAADWVAQGKLKAIRQGEMSITQRCYVVARSEIAQSDVCQEVLRHLRHSLRDCQ